jgi:hypothetical protein
MTPTGGDGESVEIGSDEYDTRGGGGREDPNPDRNAGMESYADGRDRTLNGSFKAQVLV